MARDHEIAKEVAAVIGPPKRDDGSQPEIDLAPLPSGRRRVASFDLQCECCHAQSNSSVAYWNYSAASRR